MAAPGIIIAAPASGAGKTTVTLAILRALRRRGLTVGSFKVGPDYIDPAFHRAASGRECNNLDSWAMRLGTLGGLADTAAAGADTVVGEGVMGLFDGAPGGAGSTADLASLLGAPVVLVIDATGMGASAAALAEGFIRHRTDVEVVALIFNRVTSPVHIDVIAQACDDRFSHPILGFLPRDAGLELPGRHLGLVQAPEIERLEAFLEHAAGLVEEHIDLDRLLRLARPFGLASFGPGPAPLPPLGQRIAVASDVAFGFAYPAVIDGWRREGAEIFPFSPLADEEPDWTVDAIYLPGGYPELHAGRLAAAGRFVAGLRKAAERRAFVYGECGGYMVLGKGLIDADGHRHAMANLLPLETSFAKRRLHLGYRQVRLLSDSPLGEAGAVFRGHEFHYATATDPDADNRLFSATDARGRDLGAVGLRSGSVAGSFVHLIDQS